MMARLFEVSPTPAPVWPARRWSALDQMDSDQLTRQQLAELLERGDDALTAAALGVLRNRPEWADEMVGTLAGWLAEPNPSPERQAELRHSRSRILEQQGG